MADSGVPKGYNAVIPYLLVKDGGAAMAFLVEGLGGTVVEHMKTPEGRTMHGEVRLGDSMIMLGEARDPLKPLPTMLYLYSADCDAAYRRALAAGATSLQEPRNEFYGDRTAAVKDAEGTSWYFATRKENVPADELQRRALEARKG